MTYQKRLVYAGLGAWMIYLAFLPPSFISWDGGGMLNVAVSIVEKHNITVDPANGMIGRGGQYYSLWYPLLSFLAIPFVYVGKLLSNVSKLPPSYVFQLCALLLSTMIAAANVAATGWLGKRLGLSARKAIAASLVFGFCTLSITYARTFLADPLLALCTTLALCFAFGEDSKVNETGAGVCTALAILAKPTGIVLAPVLFIYFSSRGRMPWRMVAGASTGVLLYMAYNFARFGAIWNGGQPNHWDITHMPIGVLGLLASPGLGLVVFCPIVFLGLPPLASKRREQITIFCLAAAFVLLYAAWGQWYATNWGPRFLFPTIPMLVVLSAFSRYRKVWILLAALGFLIQVPTWVATPERYVQASSEAGISTSAQIWNPADSSMIGIWKSAAEQWRDARNFDVRQLREYRPHATRVADSRNYKIVPLWWWVLPMVNLPRLVGLLAALGAVCVGVRLAAIGYFAGDEQDAISTQKS